MGKKTPKKASSIPAGAEQSPRSAGSRCDGQITNQSGGSVALRHEPRSYSPSTGTLRVILKGETTLRMMAEFLDTTCQLLRKKVREHGIILPASDDAVLPAKVFAILAPSHVARRTETPEERLGRLLRTSANAGCVTFSKEKIAKQEYFEIKIPGKTVPHRMVIAYPPMADVLSNLLVSRSAVTVVAGEPQSGRRSLALLAHRLSSRGNLAVWTVDAERLNVYPREMSCLVDFLMTGGSEMNTNVRESERAVSLLQNVNSIILANTPKLTLENQQHLALGLTALQSRSLRDNGQGGSLRCFLTSFPSIGLLVQEGRIHPDLAPFLSKAIQLPKTEDRAEAEVLPMIITRLNKKIEEESKQENVGLVLDSVDPQQPLVNAFCKRSLSIGSLGELVDLVLEQHQLLWPKCPLTIDDLLSGLQDCSPMGVDGEPGRTGAERRGPGRPPLDPSEDERARLIAKFEECHHSGTCSAYEADAEVAEWSKKETSMPFKASASWLRKFRMSTQELRCLDWSSKVRGASAGRSSK